MNPNEIIEIIDGESIQPKPDKTYKVYKLRRKSTGLYSSGGSHWIYWKAVGKTWKTLGALSNHLTQHKNGYGGGFNDKISWADVEIVTIEISEKQTETSSAFEYVTALRERVNKRKIKEKISEKERAFSEAKRALDQAKSQFGRII